MDKFLTASSSAMDNSSQSNAESGDEILTESEILESEEYDSHSENERNNRVFILIDLNKITNLFSLNQLSESERSTRMNFHDHSLRENRPREGSQNIEQTFLMNLNQITYQEKMVAIITTVMPVVPIILSEKLARNGLKITSKLKHTSITFLQKTKPLHSENSLRLERHDK
jgi:hypothetical protein